MTAVYEPRTRQSVPLPRVPQLTGTTRWQRARRTFPDWAVWAVSGLCLVLWLFSLGHFDLAAMSGFGLLNAAPLTWFVAATLGFVGYLVIAASGRASRYGLAALHTVVVLVLYGTTSVLYPEPRYTWMYKHIGMVEYLLRHHSLDRSVDVYHNWPGFFVLAAGFTEATGISPLTAARWSEVFFGLVIGLALHYALGGLTTDRRVRWTSVAVYTLVNWIGQGYYAPQAFATVMMMVFFGAILRLLGNHRVTPRRGVQWVLDRVGASPCLPASGSRPSIDRAIALAAFALLTMTHQLSPPAALLQLAVLAATVRFRPIWMLVVPVVMEVAWVGLVAWPYASEHLKLLNVNLTENIAVPGSNLVASLPGMELAKWSGPAMMATVALLALAGVITRWVQGWVDLPVIALAGGPVLILGLNSYGSEALFRVYLYALPWLSFLAARFLLGHGHHPSASIAGWPGAIRALPTGLRTTLVRQVAAGLLIVPITLTANFFSERSNIVTDADLAVATWFDTHTEGDAFAMLVAPSYPTRATGAYPGHIIEDGAFAPAVTSWMKQTGRAEYAFEASDELFGIFNWRPGYLVFTPSERNYAQMWGLLPGSEYDRFRTMVAKSPNFTVVYRRGEGMIAKYVGPAT
ncbi:MAG: hypothetical protein IPK24_22930 [Kineosporiaceae bacterium]|nr:hypothetical protein [Kineosporiaceae bacterium]